MSRRAKSPPNRRSGRLKSLSARLLILTTCFVMLSEVLIFGPSFARYRVSWLTENLDRRISPSWRWMRRQMEWSARCCATNCSTTWMLRP